MTQINMLEAKTKLSQLVEAVESGKEQEIVLARNGKPVARIVALQQPVVDASRRLGIAEGMFDPLDDKWVEDFEAAGKDITRRFYAKRLSPSFSSASRAPQTKRRQKP